MNYGAKIEKIIQLANKTIELLKQHLVYYNFIPHENLTMYSLLNYTVLFLISLFEATFTRATQIGYDKTPCVRKWEDKDIRDLIGIVDLTIRWIESEIETKHLLEEMPEA